MPLRPGASLLVLLAVQLAFVFPAPSEETLDLSVQPGDVEGAPPSHGLLHFERGTSAWSDAGPGAPGWSVRPEIELDVGPRSEDGVLLRSLNPELESLGLRLKRTW